MSMSDRIGVMQDGRVVDTGSPRRLYNQPRTRFVAEFLGDATVLAGTVTDLTADTVVIETAAGDITAETLDRQPATGEQVTVAVRPETVRLGDGPITGEVVDTAYKGFYAEATVDCGGPELVVRRQRRTAVADGGTGDTEGLFSVGETVRLRVERAVVVADGDG